MNEAAFEVSNERPAYFLLSDIYYPGWKAAVDGQERPILLADYAFRAVYLEPGTHIIEMWFEPPGWREGVILSGVTWLFVILFALWFYKWQRRSSGKP